LSGARDQGTVEAIFVAARAGERPQPIPAAELVPGRGVRGDRYFAGAGEFSERPGNGRDLTLIEAEAIEGLAAEHGIEIEPGEARRNVLTRGIDLNALVGRRFQVGEVECRGDRRCDPCSHLEKLNRPGVLRGLVDRGGLRADVLSAGTIRPGDEVIPLE
jgi:MOSC domain-containing protein YiiM